MVPPLFDMRLCSLSVPSAAVLDDPTLFTATTIRITGSVSSGSVVTGFVVSGRETPQLAVLMRIKRLSL